MAWTYNSALATDKDRVRFRIGDTTSAEPLVSDEEITYALSARGSVIGAAAFVALALAAKFAREETHSTVGFSVTMGKSEKYRQLAEDLEAEASGSGVPTAGGIERAEKDAAAIDPSLVPRFARIGMHDNPPSLVDERIA
jgi:hypothetical protein